MNMKSLLTTTAIAALSIALAGEALQAMPLQMRDQAPAVGARQSNTYHGPGSSHRGQGGSTAGGGVSSESAPAATTAWMQDQEVMSTRQGRTEIIVRIENISPHDALVFSDGSSQAAGMSHGVYAIHQDGWPVYEPGEWTLPATGLERLAEDGNVRPMQAYLEKHPDVVESGIFYKPLGSDSDGELWPGDVYEFHITANPGEMLSFATMLMQSNDIIYGPVDGRLPLFTSNGILRTGDISGKIGIFDAGTEANEDPLTGPNVGLNQQWLDSGEAEDEAVRDPDDGFPYPAASTIMRITVRAAN